MLFGDPGDVTLARIQTGGRLADAGVACLGGVIAPLSGFSGLAPHCGAPLRGYTKDEHRAVLQNFNLIVLGATMASLVWSGRANARPVAANGAGCWRTGSCHRSGVRKLHRDESGGVSEKACCGS